MNQKELVEIIREGKHQTLDFQSNITDTKITARTIAAFANSEGGRLLIGIKDRNNIVGVDADKATELIKEAVQKECQPPVPVQIKSWIIEDKTILEITINESTKKPHFAPDETNNPTVFIRVKNQLLLANRILMEVWKKERQGGRGMLKVGYNESKLLNYLNNFHQITFSKFCGMANISPAKAEKILIHLVHMKVLEMVFTEGTVFYQMNSNPYTPEPNTDVVLGDF